MNELKPCPFCEGQAEMAENVECIGHGDYATFTYAKCKNCGATSARYSNWEIASREYRESFARRAWNRRAEDG
jgi:Lar family restriction alleviation protein